MAETAHPVPQLCPRFHRASELIGRRWTGAIIFVLLRSRCRFAMLREAIPDITDRMLSERLQELEREGVVARTVIPDTPVRVEYELTRKGRALAAAIDAIAHWADRWIAPDGAGGGVAGAQAPTPPPAGRTRAAAAPRKRQGRPSSAN